MPCSLKIESVLEETRSELGGSGIDVELQDTDIKKALKDAVRVYNHHRPRRFNKAISVTPGQTKYGPIIHPKLVGVQAVSCIDAAHVTGRVDPFDPFSYQNSAIVGGSLLADRELSIGTLETARRQLGVEPEWRGQWEGADYYLYISVSRTGYLVSYEATWHITADNDPITGLWNADATDEDWILNYTTAKAKMILSRIRGKFGGITNSEGSQDPTDSESLASEAREDLTILEERIRKRRRPLAPLRE